MVESIHFIAYKRRNIVYWHSHSFRLPTRTRISPLPRPPLPPPPPRPPIKNLLPSLPPRNPLPPPRPRPPSKIHLRRLPQRNLLHRRPTSLPPLPILHFLHSRFPHRHR